MDIFLTLLVIALFVLIAALLPGDYRPRVSK